MESILVQKAAGGPSVGMTVAENHALLTLNGPPIEGKPAMGMVFVMAGPDSVTFSLSQGADTRNVGGNDRLDKMIRNGLLVKVSEERTTLHAGRDGQGSLEFASEPVKGKHLFVSGPGKLPQTFTAP